MDKQTYADLGYNFRLGLDPVLDNNDGINTRNSDQVFEDHSVVFNYTTMDTLNPDQDMQSSNFVTGLQGWKIYGDGFAEFSGITLTGGLLHYNKTSFTDSSVSGYYISSERLYFGDVGDATKLKFTISTGALEYVGLVSGRESTALAAAISAAGEATALEDAIVSNAKIIDGAVDELKISNDAVTAAKLAVAAIDGITGNLVANSVGTTQITDDAVTSQKIIANAITAGKIDANAVTAVKINAGAITTDKLDTNAVTSDKIVSNAITSIKINAGAITAVKMAVGALDAYLITGATIRTAADPAQALVLNSSNLTGYDAGGFNATNKRVQLDYNSLEFSNSSGDRRISYTDTGIDMWWGSPGSDQVGGILLDSGYFSVYGTMANNITIGTAHRNSDNISRNLIFTSTEVGGAVETLGSIRRELPSGASVLSMGGTVNRIEANWFKASSTGYINFTSGTPGSGSYGFRMNSNELEYYDSGSGGTWKKFNDISGGGGGTVTSVSGGTNIYISGSATTTPTVNLNSGLTGLTSIAIAGNINFDTTSRRLVFGAYSYGPKAVVIGGTTYYLLAQY